MRILHIDTGPYMRGGQIQVMLTLNGLQRSGHECVLLARQGAPLWRAARDAAIPAFPASLSQLWKQSAAFDVIHVHDAHAHTMAALVSRRPFVVSRRVAFPLKRSLGSNWKYGQARRFIAVSHFVAQALQSAGIPAKRIDVVYDAVEVDQQAPPWDAGRPAVVLASRDPQKGRALAESAARLAGVPLVLSTDLKHDLLNASMFVYITQSEGLGSAALLAMALGVPVIASRVDGLAEVFEHQRSGIYVANDAQEIASAMRIVRENRALAETLMVGGRQRVSKMFTTERLIQDTLKSYERALAC